MRSAFVLAAGLGTRLRPLTDELPKALVPVGDSSALEHAVRAVRRGDETHVVVNAHHHAGAVVRAALALGATPSNEARILGTAGALAYARASLGDRDVVVWNADIVMAFDVSALERSRVENGAAASWAIAPRARGEGTVGVDRDGFVVRVRDVRAGVESSGGDYLGVAALGRELVAAVPDEGCLVGDVQAPLVARGGRIATVVHEGPWDDLGTPGAYLAANLRWLAERGDRAWLGAGASAGSAPLDRVLLGEGARVIGPGALQRVVVWPGAIVEGPLTEAIVTPSRVVRAG